MRRAVRTRRGSGVLGTPKGMTLVEMLIVIIVLGAITAIIGPGLATWYRSRLVRGASDQFQAYHQLTRSSALRYGRLAELHIDATNDVYWIEVDTSGTNQRDTIGAIQSMPSSVSLTSTRQLLCFDSRGLPTTRTTSAGSTCDAPNVTVIFTLDSYVDTVKTTALGLVER